MRIKVITEVELEIPDGATHWDGCGNLAENSTFYKRKDVADYETWWYWCSKRNNWFLARQGASPHWMKKLPPCAL